ncbi:hypothetical protein C8R45DRAFT_1188654 [Mycena sanguinolenta]|nr:hypothetical protein C8R45DRAFT_1188654 [Mycena sanguinolenta]
MEGREESCLGSSGTEVVRVSGICTCLLRLLVRVPILDTVDWRAAHREVLSQILVLGIDEAPRAAALMVWFWMKERVWVVVGILHFLFSVSSWALIRLIVTAATESFILSTVFMHEVLSEDGPVARLSGVLLSHELDFHFPLALVASLETYRLRARTRRLSTAHDRPRIASALPLGCCAVVDALSEYCHITLLVTPSLLLRRPATAAPTRIPALTVRTLRLDSFSGFHTALVLLRLSSATNDVSISVSPTDLRPLSPAAILYSRFRNEFTIPNDIPVRPCCGDRFSAIAARSQFGRWDFLPLILRTPAGGKQLFIAFHPRAGAFNLCERWHIDNILAVLNDQFVPSHPPRLLNINRTEVVYTGAGAAAVYESESTRMPRLSRCSERKYRWQMTPAKSTFFSSGLNFFARTPIYFTLLLIAQ